VADPVSAVSSWRAPGVCSTSTSSKWMWRSIRNLLTARQCTHSLWENNFIVKRCKCIAYNVITTDVVVILGLPYLLLAF